MKLFYLLMFSFINNNISMKNRFLILFIIPFSLSANADVSTLSKSRMLSLIKVMKEEGKTPLIDRKKVDKRVFHVLNKHGKKVRTYLKKKAAIKFSKKYNGYTVKGVDARLTLYTIHAKKKKITQATFESSSFPFRSRVLNSSNLSKKDYNANYFEISKGVEVFYKDIYLSTLASFESYDISNEADYNKLYPKQLYAGFKNDNIEINIGPQIRVWGDFDEQSELDVITLKHTKRLYFDDNEDLRRPMNLIHMSKYIGDSKIEMAINVPIFGGYFSNIDNNFFGVNKESGKIRGVELPSSFNSILNSSKINNIKRKSIGFAGRYSFHLFDKDFQFVISKMQSDIPNIVISDELLNAIRTNTFTENSFSKGIEVKYFDILTMGFSINQQFSNFLMKGEFAYKSGYKITSKSYRNINVSKLSSNLGGEYELSNFGTSLLFQLNSQLIKSDEELLSNKSSHTLIGEFAKPILSETTTLRLRYAYELNKKGYMLTPSIDYELNDETRIKFSSYIFSGEESSNFGFNKDNDFIELEIKLAI